MAELELPNFLQWAESLSTRARNCLFNSNIRTFDELLSKSDRQLLALRNFGKSSLRELKARIRMLGLEMLQVGEQSRPLLSAELKRYGIIPCSRCAFFRPEEIHPGGNRYGRGTCRRESPKRSSWPEVSDDPDQGHGCGEGLLHEEAAPLPAETNKETK